MPVILAVIGARPQFIKHAPVQTALQGRCRLHTLHTGQHYDAQMSADFFGELQMPLPGHILDLSSARSAGGQTGLMMSGIEDACARLRPDAVLLYGDTASTLAGALVAARLHIPAIHIEAGIRSYNRAMPEEVNRIVADTFAGVLCCPIAEAVTNLQREGIDHDGVHLTGDVMCDMLRFVEPRLQPARADDYYFATVHRPYNTDDPARLRAILGALNGLAHPVVLPLHPRTKQRMLSAGIATASFPNIAFIEPIGYLSCLAYQLGAACVITDSGGIQKEAYMLGRKCVTLRSETEWNATLAHGWNTLVFDDVGTLGEAVSRSPGLYVPDMFGDGHAAERIADIVAARFGGD